MPLPLEVPPSAPSNSLSFVRHTVTVVAAEPPEPIAPTPSLPWRFQPHTAQEVATWDDSAIRQRLLATAAVVVYWHERTQGPLLRLRALTLEIGRPLFVLCGSDVTDHIAALVLGADGVLARPLSAEVLHAQLRAWRRRHESAPQPPQRLAPKPVVLPSAHVPNGATRLGPFDMVRERKWLAAGGRELALTPREFDLLLYLLDQGGLACTRDELLLEVWGLDFDPNTNVVDAAVYALRRKLRTHGISHVIKTVRGVGYRASPEVLNPV